MTRPGNRSRPPQPHAGHPRDDGWDSSGLRFSARIESFSDITGLGSEGYYHDCAGRPTSPSLDSSHSLWGWESLVSLSTHQSESAPGPSRPQYRAWTPGVSKITYQKIGGTTWPSPKISASTQSEHSRQYFAYNKATAYEVAEERESMDIALIPAEAGADGTAWPASAPTPSYTDFDMSIWREQEKAGKLSNGLGVGPKPPTMVRETELFLSGRADTQRLSPLTYFSRGKTSLSRTATRRVLGQSAADRAGQAVEVIIEDIDYEDLEDDQLRRSDTDTISELVAEDAVQSEEMADLKGSRARSESNRKEKRTETFYPHPNWKPVPMRWPYLLMLTMLSATLAGLTESLYQSSTKRPLVSFTSPQEINPGMYFVVKFLPTILAVLYGVLWQVTDLEVRRLEAYYQLSKKGGATAAETLNVDYITDISFLRPLYAYRLGHYAVMVSSMASLLAVSAVPTLTSACIILTPDREERIKNLDGVKNILIDGTWSRMLEVVFFLIAVMGAVLFYQLGSRRSGLLADVRGIAGLAAMANVSHILM
jgi:hypothetical protein